MSACSNFTSPGPAQAYLLILITLLFYLEMRKMPLECYMQARSARQKRLDYNPTFLLVPDQDFCKDQDYSLVYQTRTENFRGRAFFRRVFRNYSIQYNFTIIFPLGLFSNVTVNEALFEEHTGFDGILQADLDTYRNLTLKKMSACSNFTSPGPAQAYLLILITLLFYLEMRKMPLECYMQARAARQKRLYYNPTFVLAPDQDFCKDHDYLLVYQTRTSDFEGRAFFRKVFSNYSNQYNFTIVFPLGLSSNFTVNEALVEEHTKFGDILQADFLDTYRNLTLKTYAYSRYISQNCTNVLAVIKIDDDIVFNVNWMFDYLSEMSKTTNTLHCRTVEKPFSIRDKASKWYISEKDYPFQYFPEYCLSPLIAATPVTIKALHDATTKVPHVWLDDVFSTGLVAREAGVNFRNLSINVETNYSPFLARTVIAQYLNKTDDMTTLLEAMKTDYF